MPTCVGNARTPLNPIAPRLYGSIRLNAADKRECRGSGFYSRIGGMGMMIGNPNDDEQVDLLGISRREKRLHGTVYALLMLGWIAFASADALMGGCRAAQYPQTGCIIEAVTSINIAALPALLATIALVWFGRSTRAVFRRMLMVLPVIRDKYAENLEAAEARGVERGVAIGEERGIAIGEARGEERGEERGVAIGEERGEARGVAIGEAKIKADSKAWYARKQRAEDNDEPFDEPPPWEE